MTGMDEAKRSMDEDNVDKTKGIEEGDHLQILQKEIKTLQQMISNLKENKKE
jgi:hypothetical protein